MGKKPTEADQLLKNMPLDALSALNKVYRNEEAYDALRYVLNLIMENDQNKIIRGAGGVSSFDSLIDNASKQSFYRGRISVSVLINALIKNAPEYLELRSEGNKKKPKKRS